MESTAGTVSAQSEKVESLERENRALKAALEERDAALQDARATLVRSAAYNKRVYQDAPVPIVIIDPAIGIVDCNQAAVRIYGFSSRDEVLGKMPLDFSAPTQYDGTDTQTAGEEITRTIFEHGIANFLWRARRANGEIFDAEVNLMAFDCGGRILLRFTVDDVSEKRRARQEIDRQQAEIRKLLAGAAGHLREHSQRHLLFGRRHCLAGQQASVREHGHGARGFAGPARGTHAFFQ
jgi:two-component system sensor histidine kinase/response regulator